MRLKTAGLIITKQLKIITTIFILLNEYIFCLTKKVTIIYNKDTRLNSGKGELE